MKWFKLLVAPRERWQLFQQLKPSRTDHVHQFMGLGAFKVFFLLLSLVSPLFYMLLINDVMIGRDLSMLGMVILGTVGVYALETFGIVWQQRISNRFYSVLKVRLKKRLMVVLTAQPAKDISGYTAGDLKNRLEADLLAIEKFMSVHCLDYGYAAVSAVVLVAIMIYISPILAFVGLLAVPLSFWFASFMSRKSGEISAAYRVTFGEYETFAHTAFQNWKTIKSLSLEAQHTERLKVFWDKLTYLFIRRQVYWFINRGFIAFKDFFITKMNLYFVGGLLIIQGDMNVGVLLVFMTYYGQFFKNIETLTTATVELQSDRAAIDRVLSLVNLGRPKPSLLIKRNDTVSISPKLAVKDLHFGYGDSDPVLKAINFEVQANSHLAITGPSGCGKTTLVNLLLGLDKPIQGFILIDNRVVTDMTPELRRQVITGVMQEPYLFHLSLAENLRVASPKASQEAIESACQLANIHDFIISLPKGYDTMIGEKGIKLSGGQKQRLAIARAILLNSDIIVFDEATSALDHENEKMIMASIKALASTKTVISIAHRPATLHAADRVLILDKGVLEERFLDQRISDKLILEN